MLKKILEARAAGVVQRFHTVRLLHPENVAEHSFNVVNIVVALTQGTASQSLLLAALAHDMGEVVIGDYPANIKKQLPTEVRRHVDEMEMLALHSIHPYLPVLPAEEHYVLELADRLDGLLKCRDELRMGNKDIIPIGERYVEYLMKLTDDNKRYAFVVEEAIYSFRREYIQCPQKTTI